MTYTAQSIYGPLLSTEGLRQDAIAHITKWAPSYLDEVSRQYTEDHDSVTLPMYRGFSSVAGNGALLPMCVVAVTNTEGEVMRTGAGPVGAHWALGLGSVVSAPTRDEAQALASLYGAAMRGIFVQHPGVGTHVRGTTWVAEWVEELSWDTEKAIVAYCQTFVMDVPNMVNWSGGITAPPEDPTLPISEFVLDSQTIGVTKQ